VFKNFRPWNEVEGYVPSKFTLWLPTAGSMHFIRKMQQRHDFSIKGIKNWLNKRTFEKEIFTQR